MLALAPNFLYFHILIELFLHKSLFLSILIIEIEHIFRYFAAILNAFWTSLPTLRLRFFFSGNKAKAALKTAETRARKAANEALETEKQALEFHKAEAEKERIAAIKAQQAAEAAIRKSQIERTYALRVAENATRKKNAAYSAAERFKRKAEKTKA